MPNIFYFNYLSSVIPTYFSGNFTHINFENFIETKRTKNGVYREHSY